MNHLPFSSQIYVYKQPTKSSRIILYIRISDLAYTVDYNDPKYFSSCFKKKFNIIPREMS